MCVGIIAAKRQCPVWPVTNGGLSIQIAYTPAMRNKLPAGAARGFIVAGHHAPLAPLFVLLLLFLADLAPPFSFFIHLGLLPLTGLLPAFLLIALFGHQITPRLARGITLRLSQTFRPARNTLAREGMSLVDVEAPAQLLVAK